MSKCINRSDGREINIISGEHRDEKTHRLAMFEPTIKYKRVDQVQQVTQSLDNLTVKEEQAKPETVKSAEDTKEDKGTTEEKQDARAATVELEKKEPNEVPEKNKENEEKKEPTIEVDPSDDERILITLGSGKQYTADRYCPHAGADLSYLGEVAEDEYPPEIGPVLLCTLHYWEFGLDKGGRSGGGWASLNACPHQNECKKDDKLDW
ncbi:hypothetical protein BCR43DRAFT_217063 [Syncephalastrum racemosum]|uniref:Rieske domain-containing protein n=1 Tax=Syncephalastrum racemosum TaxID=13706 RepID=A0A1X2HIZ1_SYNRA|nr:hypothetical protein BCR43DRAFT_217063 [Syncephalastrum racemosum]